MKTFPEKLLEWSEKIKRQKLSNKGVKTWCQEEGVPFYTFQYWERRIKKLNPPIPSKRSFLEIPEDHPLIEISFRGAKLTISREFDRNALMYFLSLLKGE